MRFRRGYMRSDKTNFFGNVFKHWDRGKSTPVFPDGGGAFSGRHRRWNGLGALGFRGKTENQKTDQQNGKSFGISKHVWLKHKQLFSLNQSSGQRSLIRTVPSSIRL